VSNREQKQIVLLDPVSGCVGNTAERLRMQGYSVVVVRDPAEGARIVLCEPPAAVVADLWMPSISGVQLCRLLRAEPATENVPVILRGPDTPRNVFWAERAGAAAYIGTGRMGDLARALAAATATQTPSCGFFTAFPMGGDDIRERIASHLDTALFESVLASEVRALGTCGAFDRLFDLLSQFTSRVMSYRWMAVATHAPHRMGLHANPDSRQSAESEARAALDTRKDVQIVSVEDDDAVDDSDGPPVIVHPITLGDLSIGTIAMAPRCQDDGDNARFVSVIARELAGPIRMATLVEESHRLATIDALTGLSNRRFFSEALERELARSQRHGNPLSVILFDVDHFKQVNDKRGHHSGDLVLTSIGQHLAEVGRRTDWYARWGGEEFIVALSNTDEEGARVVADRLRAGIEALDIRDARGERIPVTASFGVTRLKADDSISTLVDRADQAMYAAKTAGRNRVVVAPVLPSVGRALDPEVPLGVHGAAAVRDHLHADAS
jgi:two-component system, cell cycle response regulator